GGGAIINIASATALVPVSGRPAYNASKGAVVAFTKSLALDLASSKIRVNCVCPGAVNTPLLRGAIESAPDPQAALKAMLERYPLARLAEPEEIAHVVVFLASAQSSYVTGATLAVDGGRTMH
ncbi:MAG: short-chain dehydrogenase, partial [Acidobacteria bacterium]